MKRRIIHFLLVFLFASGVWKSHAEDTEITTYSWTDNSSWAGYTTGITTSGDTTTLSVSGYSQVRKFVTSMEKWKAYSIEMLVDVSGDIDSISIGLRKDGPPYTYYCTRTWEDVSGTNIQLKVQCELNEDLAHYSTGIFLVTHGTGTIVIKSFHLYQREECELKIGTGWVDNTSWYQGLGLTTSITNSNDQYTMSFSTYSQVYKPVSELLVGKVYSIEMVIDATGDIDSLGLHMRMRGAPYTFYGSSVYTDVSGTNIKLKTQFQINDYLDFGTTAVYIVANGTGSYTIKSFIVYERDDFQVDTNGWTDDGAWANSPTTITADGADTELEFVGFSQVRNILGGALTEDKCYQVEIKFESDAVIDYNSMQVRGPFSTIYRKFEPQGDSAVLSLQFKAEEDVAANGSRIYLLTGGEGTITIKKTRVYERDDFVDEDVEDNSGEQLISNGDFSLNSCGWFVSANGSFVDDGSNGFNMVATGATTLVHEETIKMRRGINYSLSLYGSGTFSVYVPDAVSSPLTANLSSGSWSTTISLPATTYGEHTAEETCYIKLYCSSAATLQKVVLGVEETAEAAVKIPDTVKADYSSIILGNSVALTLYCKGVSANETVDILMQDPEGNTIESTTATVTQLTGGGLGATFTWTPQHTGWFEYRISYDGTILPGPPSELSVLPPQSNVGGDFVLGSHFKHYEITSSNGVYSFYDNYASTKIAHNRLWGITASRQHPPESTKWYRIEQEQGVWTYHDSVISSLTGGGIDVLGSLDRTAEYATTAPSSVTSAGSSGWPAYPPSNIQYWQTYVANMVNRYDGEIEYWEVWNEPDGSFLQLNPDEGQTSKVAEYMNLLTAAYTTAKNTSSSAKIVAGAVTAGGKSFLLNAIDQGMLDYCDVISFHGYGRMMTAPYKGGDAFSDIVDSLTTAMQNEGKTVEIWDSEAGYHICDGREGYENSLGILKAILAHRMAGISRYYLYAGFFKGYPGQDAYRMMVGYNKRPMILPVLCSVYSSFLGDASFVSGVDSSTTHVYKFEKADGTIVIAAWANSDGETATLPVSGLKYVYNQYGNQINVTSGTTYNLSTKVVYFVCQ